MRQRTITAVGPAAQLRSDHPGWPERELGRVLLAPGFVDAHCHLEWSLSVPRPSVDFAEWMGRFLALRGRMEPGDNLIAARAGALGRLRAGTTTLADNGPTGVGAAALAEWGMGGIVHLEAFGDPPGGAPAADAAAEIAGRIEGLAGHGPEVGLSPHAPYTVGPEFWAALGARRDLAERSWSTHLAESPAETRWRESGDGPLPAAYAPLGVAPARWPRHRGGAVHSLDAQGAIRDGLLAAHCVRLVDGEADLLAERSASVIHCPSSNRHLLCGRMPIGRLRRAGVNLALGTDSPASGGTFDLRVEARGCHDLHAASGEKPTPEQLVRMMTVNGASALGLEGRVGALAPGCTADAVALDLSEDDDPWEALLDPGVEVITTWIGGTVAWNRDVPPDRAGPVETEADVVSRRLCYQ